MAVRIDRMAGAAAFGLVMLACACNRQDQPQSEQRPSLAQATAAAQVQAPAPAEDQSPAILAAFAEYNAAILAKDGAKAITLLSKENFDYHEKMLQKAMTAGLEELNALSGPDRMLAVNLRHKLPLAEARNWSGAQVVQYCIDKGWMTNDSLKTCRVENIKVDGNRASADYIAEGAAGPLPQVFVKEGKLWKLNEVPKAHAAIEAIFVNANMTTVEQQNVAIEQGLKFFSDMPIPDDIWAVPSLPPLK